MKPLIALALALLLAACDQNLPTPHWTGGESTQDVRAQERALCPPVSR